MARRSLITSALGFALTGKTKLIIVAIAGALLLAAVGGAYIYVNKLKSTIAKLERDNAILTTNNEVLKENVAIMRDNVKALATANHENWKTAQALIAERAAAQAAINNLAVATKNDRDTINRLNGRLQEILKDPQNDGLVAPALRETVRDVQNTRRK
jgi:cell division protein FtsB